VAGIDRGSFSEPDDEVAYGTHGKAAKVTLGMPGFGLGSESTVWLSTLSPGWSWEGDIKPGVPFDDCPLHHREYVISGRIRYAMTDGTVVEGIAGDHLVIDPGHLAEVAGDETCVLLDW
jgi:hypothetical protein